jgi:DNA polymerase II small subunit/DNA polymerase delta subunit B
MQSDFVVIRKSLNAVDNEAVIISLNDIHIGSEATDVDYVEAKLKEYAKAQNVYFGLGGDFIDNGIKASKAGPYRQTMRPSEQKKMAVRIFAPIRDRILYILPGNHENKSSQETDDNPAYDISAKLDLEDIYRESLAFLKAEIGSNPNDHKRPFKYYIAALHGAGGGVYTGGAINRTENFLYSIDGVDVLITGHTHKLAGSRPGKLVISTQHDTVYQRDMLNVISGAWCEFASYAGAAMYRPGPRKPGKVVLRGDRKEMEARI